MRTISVLMSSVMLFVSLMFAHPAHASQVFSAHSPNRNRAVPSIIERGRLSAGPVRSHRQKSLRDVPQVSISTPSYPVGMGSRETKLVPYSLKETRNVPGEITGRSFQFFTQYGTPLSERMGPYPTRIQVRSLQSSDWNELIYLPEEVVDRARSMDEYAIVVKTTFLGRSASGGRFTAPASLLLLLPPQSFSKNTPANKAVNQTTSPLLKWYSSVGAIDYEYCFDLIDNNTCDTSWTGTYWLGTYDTNAALKDLPAGTKFYWQVRANNTAGSTYANNEAWWSFTTVCNTSLITVANAQESGTGSLRRAIADICPGGVIKFDPSLSGQTITLNSTLLLYKNVTINGSDLASRITISGASSVTVFEILPGVNATLNSLVVTNGQAVEQRDGSVYAGGMNNFGTLNLVNSVVSNSGSDLNIYGNGGGIYNAGTGSLKVTGSTISGNSAYLGAGIINGGTLQITDSTITGNTGREGGGIFNFSTMELKNTVITDNSADRGAGVLNQGTVHLSNSTLAGNQAMEVGGAVYNAAGPLTVINSTFSGNSAGSGGGGIHNTGTLHLTNTILANSTSGSDCYNANGAGGTGVNVHNLIEKNASAPYPCGTPASSSDPVLGPLANNGGPTQTMALLPGSPAINAGSDAGCPLVDQRGVSRPQGSHCDMGAYELKGNIEATIGSLWMGLYDVPAQGSLRMSYTGVDNGPVKVVNTNKSLIIASERINLKTYDPLESYAEVMGLPASKLSDTFIFPWYNNTGFLDSQLRFANVGNANTVVSIKIAGVAQPVSYPLAPNQGARVTFAGVDNGPVEVKSSGGVPIIAAMRINLKVNSPYTSYSEFLGLSASSTAATRYLFPWYNNTGLLDSQLRFGNVGNATTTVTIKIGGVTQAQTFTLDPSESTRITYALDAGPVEVSSSGGVPITAAMRINLKNNTSYTSYTELMGMTGATLTDTRYLFPWYNNTGSLDSQLRFANVGNANTTVSIKVNGVVQAQTYALRPNESVRVSLAGVDSGPVEVYSSGNVPIIAALRINLKASPSYDSYYEFMGMSVGAPLGLPGDQLSTTYWFPWYNNSGLLDSQLRFGVP